MSSQTHLRRACVFIAEPDEIFPLDSIVPKLSTALRADSPSQTTHGRCLVVHVGAGIDTLLGELTGQRVSAEHVSLHGRTYGSETSKRSSIDLRTASSSGLLMNEILRPLVPKRPARPTRWRYESALSGMS
jgi:hypothetical protein